MKAQFWSFDIIFAMIIFIAAMIIITYVWLSVSGQFSIAYSNSMGNMQSQLQALAGRMLQQGSPANWDSDLNVSNTVTWSNITIGLGGQEGIDAGKVLSLAAMSNYDYQETKPAMGVGYDYFLEISGSGINITIGRNPSGYNALAIQVINEPVSIDGRQADMELELWTNTTFGVS